MSKNMALLQFWQNVLFSKTDDRRKNVDENSNAADTYRTLLCTVYADVLSKGSASKDDSKLSDSAGFLLASDLMGKYSETVDDLSGINNFAESALALAQRSSRSKRNHSKSWSCSLPSFGQDGFETFAEDLCKNLPHKKAHWMSKLDDECAETIRQALSSPAPKTCIQPNLLSITNQGPLESVPSNPRLDNMALSKELFPRKPCFLPSKPAGIDTRPQVPPVLQDPDLAPRQRNGVNSEMLSAPRGPRNFSSYPTNGYQQMPKKPRMDDGAAKGMFVRHQSPTLTTEDRPESPGTSFCTARDKWNLDKQKKQPCNPSSLYDSRTMKKSLGARRGPNSKFVPPIAEPEASGQGTAVLSNKSPEQMDSDKLKNVDPKMVELMMNEILDHGPPVGWDDIAGLEFAKNTIMEIVVWPMLRPDIFSGLRGPPKGLLLFGPPGTGKTLIGKCIASQAKATFFCISASSLTSKWVGEGEKLVRALFTTARCCQPAVIFIDEIDSLLSQRSDTEHESSRRIKTEFLVQLDGANTESEERLLIVGATNRPQELDEAARRRLVKRLYIPLPTAPARKQIVTKLLTRHRHQLTDNELAAIGEQTEGYSGADMANLCKEAALGPIRDLHFSEIERISPDQVRPIAYKDFVNALKQVRASVSDTDLSVYEEWNKRYGSGGL